MHLHTSGYFMEGTPHSEQKTPSPSAAISASYGSIIPVAIKIFDNRTPRSLFLQQTAANLPYSRANCNDCSGSRPSAFEK